jgi:adenylate kinase family enzyme
MASLINIMGSPGVGKTYLSTRLSEKSGIYFFDREIMLDEIFGDDRESDNYRAQVGGLTRSTWALAIDNAHRGISSILESPMTDVIQGKKGSFIERALAESRGGCFNLLLVYCVAPESVVMERLKSRGAVRDLPKYEAWEKFVKTFIDVPGPTYDYLRIDMTEPVERNIERVMSRVV